MCWFSGLCCDCFVRGLLRWMFVFVRLLIRFDLIVIIGRLWALLVFCSYVVYLFGSLVVLFCLDLLQIVY